MRQSPTPYVLVGEQSPHRRHRAGLLLLLLPFAGLLLVLFSGHPVAPTLTAVEPGQVLLASQRSRPVVLLHGVGDSSTNSGQVLLASQRSRPVVVLHGVGDSSTNSGMTSLCDSVRRHAPGTFVVCSSVANGFQSFRLSLEQQIDALALSVSVEPRLAGGFHAIGLSQGGLVLRGYVERGDGPPIRRLITISTPHAGIGACPAGGAWAYVCPLFCFSPYNLPVSFSGYWKDVADGREVQPPPAESAPFRRPPPPILCLAGAAPPSVLSRLPPAGIRTRGISQVHPRCPSHFDGLPPTDMSRP